MGAFLVLEWELCSWLIPFTTSPCPEVLLGHLPVTSAFFLSFCGGPFLHTAVAPQDGLGVLAVSLASEVLNQELSMG